MDDWKLDPAHDMHLQGLDRYRSPLREGGLPGSAARLLWWCMLRGVFRLWNRLEIHGREHIPREPPFLLVANHCSHLDALLLTCLLPFRWRDRTFPIAAQDVFFEKKHLAAFAATFINAFPVHRRAAGAHAMAGLRDRLIADSAVYILFPEGGRSRDGRMTPFKPGIGMFVAGAPIPVVPCHLAGALEALPPSSHFLRPKKLVIRVGPPLLFADCPRDRHGWESCAQTLERAVRSLAGELSTSVPNPLDPPPAPNA